ncbi:MAG: hypothetical protein IJR00_04310, partial [Lachnospiraceae bacterium]|nr:hypothetical protein [Lachnospiraceae bacterium]
SDICNKIDQKHGVSTIKNQLYCQFKTDGRGNNMASIVYLRDDLSQEVLIEDIARDPIVSTDGKYTWCVTDNDVYCIHMNELLPTVTRSGINPALYRKWPYLPWCTSRDGTMLFFIESNDENAIGGALYQTSADSISIRHKIADHVAWCECDIDGNVFFMGNVTYNTDVRPGMNGINRSLCRIDPDGRIIVLVNDISAFFVLGNQVFYLKDRDLYGLGEGSDRCFIRGFSNPDWISYKRFLFTQSKQW